MTTPEQQATERRDVLKMIELLQLEIVGELAFGDRPDAHLGLADGRRIGLEHTEVMDGTVAAGRSVPGWIREALTAALIAADLRVFVNLTLNEHSTLMLTRRRTRATEVAAIVAIAREALAAPAEPGTTWRHYVFLDDDMLTPDGTVYWRDERRDRGFRDLSGRGVNAFTAVRVLPSDKAGAGCTNTAYWSGSRGYLIQAAIYAKADDIEEYRKAGGDEQWLLVVGSSGGIGSTIPTPQSPVAIRKLRDFAGTAKVTAASGNHKCHRERAPRGD